MISFNEFLEIVLQGSLLCFCGTLLISFFVVGVLLLNCEIWEGEE